MPGKYTVTLAKRVDGVVTPLAGSQTFAEHIQAAGAAGRGSTQHPTKTALEQYQIGSEELAVQIPKLRKLVETDGKALEKQLDAAGAPPTPGRLPDWKR